MYVFFHTVLAGAEPQVGESLEGGEGRHAGQAVQGRREEQEEVAAATLTLTLTLTSIWLLQVVVVDW